MLRICKTPILLVYFQDIDIYYHKIHNSVICISMETCYYYLETENVETFLEPYESTDPRSLMNHKHKKHEENHTKIHHNQVAQNQ